MPDQDVLYVGQNETLRITASTASPVQFDGTGGTLEIEPGVTLSGPVLGFTATDKIAFIDQQLTTLSVNTEAGQSTATVGDGSNALLTLNFPASAVPSLTLQSDAQGSTLVATDVRPGGAIFVATSSNLTQLLGAVFGF
jgi:hypothetical protein